MKKCLKPDVYYLCYFLLVYVLLNLLFNQQTPTRVGVC